MTPDELPPYYPEVRAGPPWVTEDVIAGQVELAALAETPPAGAASLADAITDAAHARRRVVVVGSGTAEHAAFAVAEILDEAVRELGFPGGVVVARESFEASLDPPSGGVCVAVSHSGRSAMTVESLKAARLNEATTALITADPGETPAAPEADLILDTGAVDHSFCHTVGYLAPIVTAGAVASAVRGARLDSRALRGLLERGVEDVEVARALGAALAPASYHVVAGSGVDMHAARELALKIEEGARVPSAMRGLETLMHGHFVAMDETSSLVVLCTERRAREERARRVAIALRSARRLDVRTAAIVSADVAGLIGSEEASEGIVSLQDEPTLPGALASLVASAVALQQLMVGLVHALGVNPDLIRREELPYREVSFLTETKIR